MPFTPINPAAYNTQKFAYGDLLKNAMEGYELARKPKQIAQEEKQRDLNNRLLNEQGTEAEIKNRYLPRKSEADIGNTEAQTGLYGAQTKGHEIKNAIEEALGMKREQAGIESTQATTGLTKAQKEELYAMLGPKVRAKLIENQSNQNLLNAQPGKLAREEAQGLIDLRNASTKSEHLPGQLARQEATQLLKLKDALREHKHPGFKHGNQPAKLWEIAQEYRRDGDEEAAKHYEDLAAQELLNEKQKNAAKAGKVEKTPEQLEEESFKKSLGAAKAKVYQEAEERLVKIGALRQTAQSLQKMTEDPIFSSAVGPFDAMAVNLWGFPTTRAFAKELENSLGQAQLDVLSAFKGSTSDKELKKVESVTATRSNTESGVRGYINSINNLSDIAFKRGRIIAEDTGKGIPHYQALERAQREVPIPDRNELTKAKGAKSGTDKNGKFHSNIDPTNIKAFIESGGTIDE